MGVHIPQWEGKFRGGGLSLIALNGVFICLIATVYSIRYSRYLPLCMRIAKIFTSFKKSGSRNTMMMSDFKSEVEK